MLVVGRVQKRHEAAVGLRIGKAFRHHFAHDCPDSEWLAAVAAKGWVGLTHDKRIRYKPNELAAVVAHKVALLVVVGDAPFAELAKAFVATSPDVLKFVAEHQPPYIAKVYRPSPAEVSADPSATGRVELWFPR